MSNRNWFLPLAALLATTCVGPSKAQILPGTPAASAFVPPVKPGLPISATDPATAPGLPPAPGIGEAAPDSYRPLTDSEKAWYFLRKGFDPTCYMRMAATTGWRFSRRNPEEWDRDAGGYAQRYADTFLRFAIRDAIRGSMSMALNEDPRYFSSGKDGIRDRLWHAFKSTVTTRKDDGSTGFAYGRFAGSFGAAAIGNVWQPPSRAGADQVFRRAGVQIGFDVLNNMIKEFSPDLRRMFRKSSSRHGVIVH